MTDFAELTSLPGTDRERSWLERRLTFLSEKEKYIVSAIIIGRQPASMAEGTMRSAFPLEATAN